MIFSDLIFVFAFLPIYLIVSFSCRETSTKNMVSVIASLIFITWGRQWYYALIILPVFLIYILGLLSKRINNLAAEVVGNIAAVGFAAFGVMTVGTEGTLHSALISVGFLLFALRCVLYTKNVTEGMEPERSFFALAMYLISFENMLIAPLADYEDVKEKLSSRRASLSKMSAGFSAFIKGFAKTAVLGLAFERVRLAATEYAAFPWANALILLIVTFGEAYVITVGISEMSCGLSLMNGFSPKLRTAAFLPKYRLGDHISEIWSSLPKFVRACFCERSGAGVLISLAAVSLLSGIFLSFGAGAGAFFGIIILAMILEGMAPRRSRAADMIFTVVLLAAAFLALTCCSVGGISEFFSAFNPSAYEYDITFALNAELWRSLPWMIVGVIVVSPIYRIVSAAIRSRMSESESFYGAARAAETVLCAILLIIAAAASAM